MVYEKKLSTFMIFGLAFGAGLGYGLYYIHQEYLYISREFSYLHDERIELEKHIAVQPTVVERIVSKGEPWSEVQALARDTVVQVFVQVGEEDLLQPFLTPRQGTSLGSGFLINEQGDIITNAHVVAQAISAWVQIPSLGKTIIDVDIIGVAPEMDIALLRVREESLELIKAALGRVPYLELGDSDLARRSDEILALGYPLAQSALKSTTGVISGREHHFIQMSAPINPGSSGGPSLNASGKVIGINTAGVTEAQNVGYLIPINDLKIILDDLYKSKLVRKPFLGVIYINGTDTLAQFLGNPLPAGCYIADVIAHSTLAKAGVKEGDMIYQINGHSIDQHGEMYVPWSEDKVSIMDYVIRLTEGQDVHLLLYRNGERRECTVSFDRSELPPIRRIYPGLESLDYEIFAGMVVTPLTLNHVHLMASNVPGLARYAEIENQSEPALLITHIFPNSQLHRCRTFTVGSTLLEVNGSRVKTLADLRKILKNSSASKYLTIKATDNVSRLSASVFTALSLDKVLEEETELAMRYRYPMSSLMKELLQMHVEKQNKGSYLLS